MRTASPRAGKKSRIVGQIEKKSKLKIPLGLIIIPPRITQKRGGRDVSGDCSAFSGVKGFVTTIEKDTIERGLVRSGQRRAIVYITAQMCLHHIRCEEKEVVQSRSSSEKKATSFGNLHPLGGGGATEKEALLRFVIIEAVGCLGNLGLSRRK